MESVNTMWQAASEEDSEWWTGDLERKAQQCATTKQTNARQNATAKAAWTIDRNNADRWKDVLDDHSTIQ